MTTKLNLQQPAILGATVVDLASFGSREGAPFFEGGQSLIELGHRCYNGESSQGEFKIQLVALANWLEDFPSGHCLLTMVEDSQTPDVWLSRGRIAADEGGRGIVRQEGDLEWTITVDDCNNELRGQAFTEAWVRPAETDVARLVALQLYTLNGGSSTAPRSRTTCNVTVNTGHLTPNSNTISMPAKKYPAGTQPEEVVRDCADTAGKQFGVVIHHTGGSHLCLFYTVNNDHTTYLSPAKISDHLADWVPTSTTVPVFEPHWEQGVGQIIQMQTLLSGMVGVWGSSEQAVYVEYAGIEANTDYWVETYHDGISTTAGQAANRTAGILEGRRNSHVTHRVSVIMNPNQVHLIAAGMSIDVKSAVTFERGDPGGDPDAYIRRRIAEVRFEPRFDGRYWCHMDLERPPLRVAPGRGQAGPIPPVQSEPPVAAITDFLWTFESTHFDDTTGLYPVGGGSANSQWHAGFVHAHVLHPAIGNGSNSPRPPITPGTYHFRAIIKGNETYGPVGIRVDAWDSGVNQGSVWDSGDTVGVTPETVESDIVFPAGTDQFTFGTYRDVGSANASTIYEVELTHGGGGDSFVGTTPPPASTGGGSIGTSPIYSPSDHTHDAQEAQYTPIDDAGGYYTGANVEEALQELGAASGATAHVYDPRTYGAVADGATDDTTAIQDAIDAASAVGGTVNGGGHIYFISGSPALLVDQNSRIVITNLTLKFGASTVALKWAATAGGGAHGGLIDSVYFWSTSTTGTTGVYIEDQDRVSLRNVRIDACAIGVDLHPSAEWVEGSALEDVWITGCTTGIRFFGAGGTSSFHETSLRNVGVNACTTGINIQADAQMYRNDWVNVSIWPPNGGTGIIIDGEMEGFRGYVGFDGAAAGGGSATGFSVGANATGLDRAEIWTQYEAAMTGVTFTPVAGALAGSFAYKVGQRVYSTGADETGRFVGVTTSGSPASGTYLAGDFVSSHDGNVYVCTTGGTPGTWSTVGAGADADAISDLGFVGAILISDTPSTPLIFADLIQNEAEDDLVYADPG